jgi:hypothetical protein
MPTVEPTPPRAVPPALNRAELLLAGLLAVFLAVWLLPYSRLGIDPHHEGIMLKPALDVLAGQTLFRDTFMQYGALSCYLEVVVLRVSPTLLALRYLAVAGYAGTLFVLYLTWRCFLPRSLAAVAALLFMIFMPAYEKNWMGDAWVLLPWSSLFALFFQAVALHAGVRIIRDEPAGRWALLLGLACAAIFWFRQPVGIVTTGAVAVAGLALHLTGWQPVKHSKRSLLLWALAGLMIVNVLLLAGITLSGAFDAWWYQNFVWPRKWALDTGGGGWWNFFRTFLDPVQAVALAGLAGLLALPALVRSRIAQWPTFVVPVYYGALVGLGLWQHDWLLGVITYREGGWLLLLPALVAIQALLSVSQAWTGRATTRPTEFYVVAAVAAVALSSLTQYYPVPDPWHIFWALAPTFGLVLYSAWRWSRAPAGVVAAAVLVLLVPSLWSKARDTRDRLTEPHVTIESPAVMRGLRVSPLEADVMGRVMRVLDPILRLRPDLPGVMIGRDALYLCFLNNLTNPNPYFVTWPGLDDATAHQTRWGFVQAERPLLFLHRANWSAVNDFYRRARYVPLLYVPETTLEIAVPQELADALGMKAYGGSPPAKPAPESPKP